MKENLGDLCWNERGTRGGHDLARVCARSALQWCLQKYPGRSMLTEFSQLVAGGDYFLMNCHRRGPHYSQNIVLFF